MGHDFDPNEFVPESVTFGGDITISNKLVSKRLNEVRDATMFGGQDLSDQVENAAQDLLDANDGRGTIVVPSDGSPYDWSGWSFDPGVYGGIDLQIQGNTEILHTSDTEWALAYVNEDSNPNVQDGEGVDVYGGNWRAPNAEPPGFVHIHGVSKQIIAPRNVRQFENGDTDSTCIRIESNDSISGGWCEDNKFINFNVREVDRGIEWVVDGTADSFVDNRFEACSFNFNDVGVIARGNQANVVYDGLALFYGADNGVGVRLDGSSLAGSRFVGLRCDNNPNNQSGTVGVETTSNYSGNGPMFTEPAFGNLGTNVDDTDGPIVISRVDSTQYRLGPGVETGQGRSYMSIGSNGQIQQRDSSNTLQFSVKTGGNVDLNGNKLENVQGTETADGMTADPETAAEDAYITISIGGTDYQIPCYTP